MAKKKARIVLAGAGLLIGIGLTAPGCAGSGTKKPDKITQELLTQPKEQLFEKGKTLIDKKKYEEGRKYLNYVFETYPNETMGREALLMVADSYFKQKNAAAYTEARFRYRDYLNRYPGAPKRDYARYQFALCYDREHEKPDRDQTATREAIDQYNALIREFPDSGYAGAARERIRQLTDLLAEHDFSVGYFYFRKGSTAAALNRFTTLEQRFPDYGGKDKLFFHEGMALERLGRTDEARRYFGRVVEEYPKSEWAKKARSKISAFKGEKPPTNEAKVDRGAPSQ
jgi:outer membrane protein assembly factor BamD